LATGFAPPSRPEIENKKLIESRFKKAGKTFAKISKKEIKRFNKAVYQVNVKSFAEFVGAP